MLFEKSTQDIVQQLARVDRLQVERRFAAWFESQHALREEAIRTVAVDAETARTVHKVRPKPLLQRVEQMRIRDLAVVWTKLPPAAFPFDLDAAQSGVADVAVVACEREQTCNSRQRQQLVFDDRMAMTFVLTHKRDTHIDRRRDVVEVTAFVVATNDFSLDFERRHGTSQLVDVIRADG